MSVLAFAVAVLALVVSSGQLRVQRQDVLGGQSIEFGASKLHADDITAGQEWVDCRAKVRVIGPRVLYDVGLHLEMDGQATNIHDLPWPPKPVMDCRSDPLEWDFKVRNADLSRVWCLLTWLEPHRRTVRTRALAKRLGSKIDYCEWRWFPSAGIYGLLQDMASQHGPVWFKTCVGRPRPLGRWKRTPPRPLRPGQGPVLFGKPPPSKA